MSTLFDLNREEEFGAGSELGRVVRIDKAIANDLVVKNHYLHRRPSNQFSFGLEVGGRLLGAVIFGIPASRHLQMGACPSDPDVVVELNRLWVSDECPRNSESFFVSRALRELPPRIVVSYADTTFKHVGIIYRALNFHYAGWTDMERKTPRLDYLPKSGGHTRDTCRSELGAETGGLLFEDMALSAREKSVGIVRRKVKVKYWTTTGNRREREKLRRACGWPSLSWKELPVPSALPEKEI